MNYKFLVQIDWFITYWELNWQFFCDNRLNSICENRLTDKYFMKIDPMSNFSMLWSNLIKSITDKNKNYPPHGTIFTFVDIWNQSKWPPIILRLTRFSLLHFDCSRSCANTGFTPRHISSLLVNIYLLSAARITMGGIPVWSSWLNWIIPIHSSDTLKKSFFWTCFSVVWASGDWCSWKNDRCDQ